MSKGVQTVASHYEAPASVLWAQSETIEHPISHANRLQDGGETSVG